MRQDRFIVSRHLSHADVFSIARDGDLAYVNYLIVETGTIVQTHTTQVETHLEESNEEVLAFTIAQLRETFNSLSKELILPFPIDYPEEGIIQTIPKGGDKKKLLELSEKNVSYFREELRKKKMLQLEGKTPDERKQVLYQLMEDLQLSGLPVHIDVLTTPISRAAIRCLPWYVSAMAWRARKTTGISM